MLRSLLLAWAIYTLLIINLCPLLHHHRPGLLPVYPHPILAQEEPAHQHSTSPTHKGESDPHWGSPIAFLPFDAAPSAAALVGASLLVPLLALLMVLVLLRTSWAVPEVALRGRLVSPLLHPPTL